jgi:3-phenylpropionate/trans-cinnamate dioxygenase ferredoxin subunit
MKEPTTMPPFHYVCPRDQIRPNEPQTFEIDDRFVVLVEIDQVVHCIEDMCTHDGGTLGDGQLDGDCLVCPRHGAKFDVRTGKALCMPATEDTPSHTVKIDAGKIYVALNN